MACNWAEKWAVLACLVAVGGVLACLLAQGLQSADVEQLRREVESLREECGVWRGEKAVQVLTAAGQDVSLMQGSTRHPTNAEPVPQNSSTQSTLRGREPAHRAVRVERDSRQKSKGRQKCDTTIIHWQKILHTGKSIEQNNSMISIKGSGYYFIYTQVLYQDQTFVMGHIIKRKAPGSQKGGENLLRCTCNMPEEHPFSSCYSAGIYRLEKGDIIELVIPRSSARIAKEKDSTYMGLLKLGPT
ncbi:tumor necrosis factor ligand superfamily member 13B-like isoform X2 [Pristis pectinata]|uniref:tumor necrosis factor ligand superfamily member 13B-like isoform X2 n=1 Tax=Pristis pectinata TaxID=685728 RepID=UPI00223D2B15|nr:tumor necrosis factor ligand superfamily member 13B-like isoform X2 [Pristis pectinata]